MASVRKVIFANRLKFTDKSELILKQSSAKFIVTKIKRQTTINPVHHQTNLNLANCSKLLLVANIQWKVFATIKMVQNKTNILLLTRKYPL